jgi:hypothetical protein
MKDGILIYAPFGSFEQYKRISIWQSKFLSSGFRKEPQITKKTYGCRNCRCPNWWKNWEDDDANECISCMENLGDRFFAEYKISAPVLLSVFWLATQHMYCPTF